MAQTQFRFMNPAAFEAPAAEQNDHVPHVAEPSDTAVEVPSKRYGQRLVPQVADELASLNPGKIYASITTGNSGNDYREVTIKELVHAANHLAWFIKSKYGMSESCETLIYMGTADIRYTALFIAAVKCCYKLMVPSMRNSANMNRALMETTNCRKVFYSDGLESKADQMKNSEVTVETCAIAQFDQLLSEPFKHFPYEKSYEDRRLQVGGIKTTHSGTSMVEEDSIPRIHRFAQVFSHLVNCKAKILLKLAGFVTMCFLPIMYPATAVLGPPDRPPTGAMVYQIMKHSQLRAITCAPSILEQLIQEPGGLDLASKLDFIIYTGGPLSRSAGDALSKVTDVAQLYGSTETGVIPTLVPRQEDSAYFELQPSYGHKMELIGDDEYEMVIYKDMDLAWVRGVAHTFPEVDEWRTRDVFKPHPNPSKPGLWRVHGRRDDIMVLGNGERFNPVPMEAILQGHPLVAGALIVGYGRFHPALLIEPSKTPSTDEALIESIWPYYKRSKQ
ncbi:hypothetical protein BP6252_03593 [Coleophoma cylindrospora]|uniref:AMP-dependent synthetase/ligase domain-containing protein n=1 Tax=Coleophoma cylindrospora TaxID=1849047 RepID=A0A3D8S8L9_9HELO|nr:hypothetical protein BP6252_03593 [Coleophoma cylindrospora]